LSNLLMGLLLESICLRSQGNMPAVADSAALLIISAFSTSERLPKLHRRFNLNVHRGNTFKRLVLFILCDEKQFAHYTGFGPRGLLFCGIVQPIRCCRGTNSFRTNKINEATMNYSLQRMKIVLKIRSAYPGFLWVLAASWGLRVSFGSCVGSCHLLFQQRIACASKECKDAYLQVVGY
jgi:hypothetical protein